MNKTAAAFLFAAAGLMVPHGRAEEITFNRHVAPILWKHCAACHRPGEVAPFSLLTYKDAARRADFIREVTARREMPPWKPEPGHGDFHDVRRLDDRELDILARWAKTGAREGDPRDLPAAPVFPAEGWALGKPDLVLKMAEPFEVPANGADVYRCFVIPSTLTEDRMVSAIEFRPGNRRVVHHATFFMDQWKQARKKDEADPGPGYQVFGGLGGIIPSGDLGAWTPGMTPRFLPADVGMPLRKGADIIAQIHYNPSGKPETDQSTLGIYFNKNAAARMVLPVPLVNFNLHLPAGAERQRVAASFTLPVDVKVVGLQPHMHNLGKEMKVEAVLPDGKRQPLIWIKDWNFNWQDRYLYREAIALPRGTRLECEAFYDNSASNPLNPNRPPRAVRWGEATTDEMLLCPVYVTAERPADYLQLFLKTAAIPGLVRNWYFENGGRYGSGSLPKD